MEYCNNYLESISAYADGELPQAQARELEAHLSECEECSALFEMYREISVAASESSEPVPSELLTRVRSAVESEGSPRVTRRRANMRIALMRYMPIAACLAVALLVWGLYGNYGGVFGSRNVGRDGSSSMNLTQQTAVMEDADYFPAPERADTGSPYADSAPGAVIDATFVPRDNDRLTVGGMPGSADPNAVYPIPLPWELTEDDVQRFAQEESYITDVLMSASQWIVITGDLPSFLSERELDNLGPHFGWEMIVEIPNDDVQVLLIELEDIDGFQSAVNTSFTAMANSASLDAPNAVVLWSPEP